MLYICFHDDKFAKSTASAETGIHVTIFRFKMGLGGTTAKRFVMKLSLSSTGSLIILAQFAVLACATPAAAQDPAALQQQIQQLQADFQRQIQDLRAQLKQVQAEAARSRAAEARERQNAPITGQPVQTAASPSGTIQAAQQTPPAKPLPKGTFQLGGITVTLGGFIAVEGAYRSRNETADIGSSFGSGMPLPSTPAYHMGEFRGSARQSRVSLLAQGDPDDVTHLAAYSEVDFLGVGTTSNSAESNSYVPRLRVAYATYERSDLGLHLLGGQEWSLLTMNKVGIVPRQEDVPLTIDAQYVPGFNWTRNWQVRAAQDFDDHRFWLAASIEGPQAGYSGSTTIPSGKTVTAAAAGGSQLNGTISTYSMDVVPDFIVKAAADPGWVELPHAVAKTAKRATTNPAEAPFPRCPIFFALDLPILYSQSCVGWSLCRESSAIEVDSPRSKAQRSDFGPIQPTTSRRL